MLNARMVSQSILVFLPHRLLQGITNSRLVRTEIVFFSTILQIHAYRAETVHPYYKNGSISRILLVATLITYTHTHTHAYILSCVLAKIMVVHPRTIKRERRRRCWRGALAGKLQISGAPTDHVSFPVYGISINYQIIYLTSLSLFSPYKM